MAEKTSATTFFCIYIGEDAIIVGKEYLYVKHSLYQQAGAVKNQNPEIKEAHPSPPVENPTEEEKSESSMFVLPPSSESLSFSTYGGSAIIVQHHRQNRTQATGKINRENRSLDIEDLVLPLFFPKLRHKFSPAAIQCGILISFGANYPPIGA